jgi:four helix bundle protein
MVMIIKSLEELQVYQQALRLADEISAILDRAPLRRHPGLRKQLDECSARIPVQISEGFGQRTDRHCAHYQSIARGSCNEICGHLSVAAGRSIVTPEEKDDLVARYERIGKGLTRWIQHLEREDRSNRGR